MENNNSYNQSQNMNGVNMPPKKKRGRKYIIALLILVLGIMLIIAGSIMMSTSDSTNWKREDIIKDFSEYNNSVDKIDVDFAFGDVKFQKGETLKVECSNVLKDYLDIEYKSDNTLSIDVVSEKFKGQFLIPVAFPPIGFNSSVGEIVITVPEKTFKSVKIESVFGTCTVNDIDADDLIVENVFGETVLLNTNSSQAKLENAFGSMSFKNCMLNELKAENSFGEIELDKCELSGDSKIEVSFGNIVANLYGNPDDYNYDFDVALGSCSVNGEKPEYYNNRFSKDEISVEVAFGNAEISFDDSVSFKDISDSVPDSDSNNTEDITDSNGNIIVP